MLCYKCKTNEMDEDRGGCTYCGAPYLASKDRDLDKKTRITLA